MSFAWQGTERRLHSVERDPDYTFDPILAQSEEWEDEHRQGNLLVSMMAGFALLSIGGAILYGICMIPWYKFWENIIWMWNAGPDYLHFLRWGFVASVGMMLFFAGVGLWEWWTKDRY